MKKYDSFVDWKNDQHGQKRELINSLQKFIEHIAPHLTTSVKRGQGCFLKQDKRVMYIHAASEYIQLGFYEGSSLHDPTHILAGKGKYVRYINIKETTDIDEAVFTSLINQVI